MFAQVLYAMFLAPDQAEKQRLLEEVIDYTEQAGPLVKADIVAQFGSVYAKARLAEELSVPVVLKRGYTSEIPRNWTLSWPGNPTSRSPWRSTAATRRE